MKEADDPRENNISPTPVSRFFNDKSNISPTKHSTMANNSFSEATPTNHNSQDKPILMSSNSPSKPVPPASNSPTKSVPPASNSPTKSVPPASNSPTKSVPPASNSPTKSVPPSSNSPTKSVPPSSNSPTKSVPTTNNSTTKSSSTDVNCSALKPPPMIDLSISENGGFKPKKTRTYKVQSCCQEFGKVMLVCLFTENFFEDYKMASTLSRIRLVLVQFFSSTPCLNLLMLVYTLAGAAVFVAFEAPHELQEIRRLEETRISTLESIKSLSTGNLTEKEWLVSASTILLSYTKVVEEAQKYGVTSNNSEMRTNWSLKQSAAFCLTVYSTIGYGFMTPATSAGRIFCIFYALFGIPLFLICLGKVGHFVMRSVKTVWVYISHRVHRRFPQCRRCQTRVRRCRKKIRPHSNSSDITPPSPADDHDSYNFLTIYLRADDETSPSIRILLIAVFAYMLLGAAYYKYSESWSLVDSLYFVFVTLSTIGFGDMMPSEEGMDPVSACYTFLGLIILSSLLSAISDSMESTMDKAKEECSKVQEDDPEHATPPKMEPLQRE